MNFSFHPFASFAVNKKAPALIVDQRRGCAFSGVRTSLAVRDAHQAIVIGVQDEHDLQHLLAEGG